MFTQFIHIKKKGCSHTLQIKGLPNGETIIKNGFHRELGINPRQVARIEVLPDSKVEEVGGGAFQCFEKLRNVVFQVKLRKIGPHIFSSKVLGTLQMIYIDPLELTEVHINALLPVPDYIPLSDYDKYVAGELELNARLPTLVFYNSSVYHFKPIGSGLRQSTPNPDEDLPRIQEGGTDVVRGFRPYPWAWTIKDHNKVGFLNVQFKKKKQEPEFTPRFQDADGRVCKQFCPGAILCGYNLSYPHPWNPSDIQVVPLPDRDWLEKQPAAAGEYHPEWQQNLNLIIQFGSHPPIPLTMDHEDWLKPNMTLNDYIQENAPYLQFDVSLGSSSAWNKSFACTDFCQEDSIKIVKVIHHDPEMDDIDPYAKSKDSGGLLHAKIGGLDEEIVIVIEPVNPIDQYWASKMNTKWGYNLIAWRDRDLSKYGSCEPEHYTPP